MSAAWPLVPLGEVLHRSDELVTLTPDGIYHEVTVRLWGKGVVPRRQATGAEIATAQRNVVRAGQFIVSRIDARNGALGLVPANLDGAIVSNDFPAFTIDSARLLPSYLQWLSRTHDFVAVCKAASEGTTNRVRLKEEKFLATAIPLPPLAEQRSIVARVEALAGRINQARTLKATTNQESQQFWKALSRLARSSPYKVRPLDEMVDFLDGRRIPLSEAERLDRKGPYPYYGASGIIDHIDDYLFDEPLLLLSEDGANLINRSTPIAFVATGKYWVNNHAHVLRPRPEVVDLQFLRYTLSDFDVSVFNFASAQAKLNQANARKIAFPLPPLPEQRQIVGHLDELRAKAEELAELQSQSSAALDALLPAILHRAFAGQL